MIDFVVPCHPKDIDTAKLVVPCIREHTNSRDIYIVSNDDPCIDDAIHVPESAYSEFFTLKQIKDRWESEHPPLAWRSGWIYQQLLKLFASKAIPNISETHVVVDADTMFVRDIVFDPDKFQYHKARDIHPPYVKSYRNLMKDQSKGFASFICHHMAFKSSIVDNLISYIESIHSQPFIDSVLGCINYREASTACLEYDLYGNYTLEHFGGIAEQRQMNWVDIPYIPTTDQLNEFATDYDFVSAHAYLRT